MESCIRHAKEVGVFIPLVLRSHGLQRNGKMRSILISDINSSYTGEWVY